ncbi:unnamed protein product [Penicillium salamii]|uniref:AB hydrolase-1 domain-containing protein n=1 Tax=Penicillium salamii TaxID=1612424 RepID=A0A9W4JKY9_9EURO|nr:unnamed protein product [Penicillium salamii]
MATPYPTIVLVHGAWHTPANYQSYIDDLQAAGFTVHCPRLPTCNGSRPPNAEFSDDVAHVRSIITSCVERGERVLVIMHSYGGMVGTDAAQGLDLATRKVTSQPGGVIHLLYLCAYMLIPGLTPQAIVEETNMTEKWLQMVEFAEDGTSLLSDPSMACFSGLEEQSVVDKAVETLVRFPLGSGNAVTTGDAWRTVPSTYVRTSRDCAMVPAYQDLILERIEKEGVVPNVVEFDTHHSVWISLPEEMVQMALKAAHDERNLK